MRHLRESLATGLLDGSQRRAGSARIALHHLFGRCGLDHHRAEAVSDDVVQLAGDPGALLLSRVCGGPDLLVRGPLPPVRTLLGFHGLTGAMGDGSTHQDRTDDEDRGEGEVGSTLVLQQRLGRDSRQADHGSGGRMPERGDHDQGIDRDDRGQERHDRLLERYPGGGLDDLDRGNDGHDHQRRNAPPQQGEGQRHLARVGGTGGRDPRVQ